MKKSGSKKKTGSGLIKFLISSIPYCLGVIGYLVNGSRLLDALYSSFTLYGMKSPSPPPNILLEIARWTAPLVTASGVLWLVSSVWNSAHAFLHYRQGDSVAVYGPDTERRAMLKKLGSRGVEGKDDRFIRARRYLLLGTEEENLRFYTQHREKLAETPVYLKCESLPVQSASDNNLRLFCPEETAARQYWKERGLFEDARQHDYHLKIVFLGFGRLGAELLTFGLQDNIFRPEQKIEYHIFGNTTAFASTHPQISSISDPVVFHQEPWYEALPLLEEANRVIVVTQEKQLSLLRELLLATIRPEIDVFSSDTGLDLLEGRERLKPYLWQAEAKLPEQIFSDKLYERAKRLNHRYAILYDNAADTDEAKEAAWQKLNTFTRYSNISAADYHEICLNMLQSLGKTPEEYMDLLAEMEHIRWCRYHYLNNWKYGVPKNGKLKDATHRIHKDLVPYHSLSDSEKQKDYESVRVLLSVK